MAKKIVIPKDNNIISFPLEEAMPENYLPYAVEVSKERALPDVRDGLKPVQRRIVYGSYMLKAFPDKPYYKSARIVGDILGKYHPHGDSSVYDAMVILAQDFTTRMPLIDGHGNWGSQDGDSAAAMRYTEARLTPIAMEMIRDIDKDVVNMVDNYSNSEKEPEVLPAKFPNILVNGAFGIAVGLATNIPPHNLEEVIDGTLAYIDKNEITTKELLNYIKGPDLPTGGVIIGKKSMLSAYETGEGRVTLRAKTTIEKLENGRLAIVITEFPFRKNKARLLQFISEMTADKKHSKALENITDIRDESDRNGIRAVIEFKKIATQDVIEKTLKYLYKKTDLQSNISFNMVALADGKPKTLGLKAMLEYYVEHQKEVITRRTKRELEIAEKRFHIVEGFIKAIGIMDEIIKTIRESKSKKNARENLMQKFSFTDIQAEAILELMLYKLTGLEIVAFEKEYKELERLINKLKKILNSEKELLKVIKKELIEVKETYNDKRRTSIIEDDEKAKIDIEEIIVEEDVVLTLSNESFAKRISLKSYNRSSANVEDIEYREGDFNRFLIQCNTKDTLCLVTKEGNMYQIKVINIPEFKWKEKGVKLDEIIKTIDLSETIIEAFSIEDFIAQKDMLFITDSGYIKKTTLDKFNTNYTKIMVLKLKKGESLVKADLVDRTREEKFLNIKTHKGLSFNVEEPSLQPVDRNIIGYKLFDILPNDSIKKVDFCDNYEYKSFYVNISKEGLITISDLKDNKSHISLFTDSSKTLVLFDDEGKAYYIPAFMLQGIKEGGINISVFTGDKISLLNAISTFRFEEDISIYFSSEKGLIKRTLLSELKIEGNSTQVYKFKHKEDKLVSILIKEHEEQKDILIITEKAMVIRFKSEAVNPMGKMASGVTGISLKDLDKVILASIIDENDTRKIKIKTKAKDKGTIEINKIKVQNRAGIGNSLMPLLLNDFVEVVELKK
ncbi:DNA topoisomerase IV subunit A [Clostridium botulinum]|uniref:DNA topoisomerase (ATP-hydrolyzing) n=1 Tax=Clostridium botulinum TaxID=1491 RepID=A0A846J6Z5_CLOBO|nr:DNA topoisomerase IV subunit A [Clostridium botulinum]ACA56692.1 DNA topoisomerase, GyrA/ParC subunit family [Clostridium botulinum A3 str. Loch Maree]NFH66887.1 DNA topoisomerase IV subunit A [Clostridium botulinum]NFJ07633.1 DNA topoisomerase IV subunit A [Clostridium botulinum]NFK13577.1 DNA topoisomerase IV subunit A [Clostridium botulinum]NFM94113.1 DNA topoisomerase IV subunit A [Clostridium botulinum]